MKRRDVLKWGLVAGLAAGTNGNFSLRAAETTLPSASYDRLPRWRGFNLLEKFNGRNDRFREDDFRWIRDFGFNFVRLPMDYRAWILDKDWKKINFKVLDDIDEVVRFGEKYGVHINMNFHRAPGYTVASPPEPKSVWTDPEALEVCSMHWATFAKRFRGISNDQVSFNLFNEPAAVEKQMDAVVAAHKEIIKAIRLEDPNRLIICDGYQWGTQPFFDLVDQKIGQATRGYAPGEISHYKASWVNSKDYPEPSWPTVTGNGLFCSAGKGGIKDEFKAPMLLEGPFVSETKLRLRVGTVSGNTELLVAADGKTVFEHSFKPGPGEGEWKEVVFKKEWNVYQNIYNRDYFVSIPAGTKRVQIHAGKGDWLTVTEIGVKGEKMNSETKVQLTSGWNQAPSTFRYEESSGRGTLTGGEIKDRAWLRKNLEPWIELQKKGCGVMVGEFGSHCFTPHDVALRWIEDMLINWKELGWGFALWNLRGSFGIMDSSRQDVAYEEFHGHKLDQKMLKLLQKY